MNHDPLRPAPLPRPTAQPSAGADRPTGHESVADVLLAIGDDLYEARRMRERVSVALADALSENALNDLLIVVSELVTNAIQHGTPPRTMYVHLDPDGVDVAIDDGSPVQPTPQVPTTGMGGHGLHLVGRLCAAWGSEPRPTGKRVWCHLELPRTA